MDFVNLDLTLSESDNNITDEFKTSLGTSEFNLEHDMFFVGTAIEIWTGVGKTGTQLTLTTDYTLHGENESLTRRANRSVYQRIKIVNAIYQACDLYFNYWATADYVDADDTNTLTKRLVVGSSTFAGAASYTEIAHTMGVIPRFANAIPSADSGGYLGEVWVIKTSAYIRIYNSGTFTGNLGYIIVR